MTLRKRNQYRNAIGLPGLTVVLVLCGAVLLAALSVIINKNRMSVLAGQKRQVEHEMRLLDMEIQNLKRRIDQLLDGARIQPLLLQKGTWLQKIHPDGRAIIYLKAAAPSEPATPSGTTPAPAP